MGARIQLSLKLMGWFVVGGKSAKALEGLANLFTDGGQTRLKRNTNILIHSKLETVLSGTGTVLGKLLLGIRQNQINRKNIH